MNNVKILDCTLRDGGYVNDWEFGLESIKQLITNLSYSNIDFVECGFLKNSLYDNNKSIFSNISQLKDLLPKTNSTKFALMINYGEFSIDDVDEKFSKDLMLRIAFKKKDLPKVLDFSYKLKEKGFNIFLNPMYINMYSDMELLDLISEINKIKPFAFSIVDTIGAMKEKDILSSFYLIDNNLLKEIVLCFHSHNNLQLSFSNAQSLMRVCTKRELIIDSTVFGIGRGAGNIQTEQLIKYINDNSEEKKYNIIPILKSIDEQINPIYIKTPWGYSVPYYLAAVNNCHPNYAKYLSNKKFLSVEKMDVILGSIPNDKKNIYDEELIKKSFNSFR